MLAIYQLRSQPGTGEGGLCYAGSSFHRVAPGFLVQGGDIPAARGQCQPGEGAESSFGGCFEDEGSCFSHGQPGMLSMASKGEKDSNGCQFFITTG